MRKDEFMKIVRSKAKETLTDNEIAFFEGIGEAVETAFTLDTAERNKQLKELTDKLGIIEEGKSISEVIRNLAAAVDTLEAKSKRGFSADERYKLKSLLEAKKDEIKAARKSNAPWEIEFRAKRAASALMTNTTILSGASAVNNANVFDDLEVTVIQYPKDFILDMINSRQVSKVPQTVRRKEQTTAGDGVVASTSEGAAKPQVDYKFVWKYDTRKKYAGYIAHTEEEEIDFEQLVLDVVSMFEDDVLRKYQAGVLADIVAWADTYTSTTLDGRIANPTVHTVIGAGILHVRDNNYEPDVIALNPGDVAAMTYTQDNNGNQMFLPESLMFGGLQPFVSTGITAGKILIGTRRTVKEQHGNLIVRKGTTGDQFIENESTIVGEIFSVLSCPTLSQPSWIYLDVATVKASLQKV